MCLLLVHLTFQIPKGENLNMIQKDYIKFISKTLLRLHLNNKPI